MSESIYRFDIPTQLKSIIKVIGVGGGGSNAVNYMYNKGIKDVEFLICNTDQQHLQKCQVPNKLQIGDNLTEGLGAGADPERGKNAALESKERIREALSYDTKMLFITAGMGGGTGTGAAPVIAKIARDLDILTVGIVTQPFKWEGPRKKKQALAGVEEMKQYCDTVLVVINDKLSELFGNQTVSEGFSKANDVLLTAAKSIAEIITSHSDINVDFADVKRVMKGSGAAVMGSAVTSGENRAMRAAEQALFSPLLDSTSVFGAQNILLSVSYGPQASFTMDELSEITDYIQEKVGDNADVIPGIGLDDSLGESIRVTIIATGFEHNISQWMDERKRVSLESDQMITQEQKTQNTKTPQQEQNPSKVMFTLDKSSITPVEKTEPQKEEKTEKVIFTLGADIDAELKKAQDKSLHHVEEKKQTEQQTIIQNYPITESNKNDLLEQAKERIRNMNSFSSLNQDMTPDELKEKLEIPAIMRRKNMKLDDLPHSSEKMISRLSLNEDNELLGDNKFLHDNVD